MMDLVQKGVVGMHKEDAFIRCMRACSAGSDDAAPPCRWPAHLPAATAASGRILHPRRRRARHTLSRLELRLRLAQQFLHLARAQLAVLHLLHQGGGLGAAQQAAHVAQAGAKADAAHTHAAAVALRALGEFVCVLGPLAVDGSRGEGT